MNKCNIDVDHEEIERIISKVDNHETKMITYTDFAGATLNIENILTDELLDDVFSNFNVRID